MTEHWLIFDVPNLAYRALYSTGRLSFGNQATGVLFGVLRDVVSIKSDLCADRVAFAFDGGTSKRVLLSDKYKQERRLREEQKSDADKERLKSMRIQVNDLYVYHLAEIGFNNVLHQRGYEADDLIAQAVEDLLWEEDVRVTIVSSDKDLYQCLCAGRVMMYDPRKKAKYTEEDLLKQYSVTPLQWHVVKAIAGCPGDGVEGVEGVGEITAAKYLNGKLNRQDLCDRIIGQEPLWRKNVPLVRLPFDGTDPFVPVADTVTPEKWNAFVKRFGMRSLRDLVS